MNFLNLLNTDIYMLKIDMINPFNKMDQVMIEIFDVKLIFFNLFN